ncbi:hypothetical protein TNCV_2612241 [Trichonephila clavipes]|nr:hypothetical protein TNCV_2612241 [Trichonephila clavipes]
MKIKNYHTTNRSKFLVILENILIINSSKIRSCFKKYDNKCLTGVQIPRINKIPSDDNKDDYSIQALPVDEVDTPVTLLNPSLKIAAFTETWSTIEVRSVKRVLLLKKNIPAEIN